VFYARSGDPHPKLNCVTKHGAALYTQHIRNKDRGAITWCDSRLREDDAHTELTAADMCAVLDSV